MHGKKEDACYKRTYIRTSCMTSDNIRMGVHINTLEVLQENSQQLSSSLPSGQSWFPLHIKLLVRQVLEAQQKNPSHGGRVAVGVKAESSMNTVYLHPSPSEVLMHIKRITLWTTVDCCIDAN